MANYRGGRINEEVRREVSVIIRDEIKDPRMTAMVSITSVKVSKDLKYAKVFVSILNAENTETSFENLKKSAGYIRTEIAKRINLRITPEIIFEIDNSMEYGAKMDKLIEEVRKQDEEKKNKGE